MLKDVEVKEDQLDKSPKPKATAKESEQADRGRDD